MAILEASDFVGKYKVSKDRYSIEMIQPYIDKYVPYYLARVFGATMSTALIADIGSGSAPTDPDLLLVFNPFMEDAYYPCFCTYNWYGCEENVVISNGVKEMLLGFIYFHILTDKKVQLNPVSGTSRASTENSDVPLFPEAQVLQRYNDAVDTARAIQYKCRANNNTYPDFNGSEMNYNYIL